MSTGINSQTYQYVSDLIGVIKRRWLMILSVFLITLVPSIILSLNKPVLYNAKAEMLLDPEQRAHIELSGQLSERAFRSIVPMEKLNSLVGILTGNLMIDRMIDVLEPTAQEDEKKGLMQHFQKEIHARVVPASTIIEISYAHTDPVRAQKVVNTMVDVFRDYYRHSVDADGALSFYQRHLDQINGKLKEDLAKLDVLRRQEGIVDNFERVQANVNRTHENLKVERDGLVKKISEVRIRLARLAEERDRQPEYLKGNIELIKNPQLSGMEQKLTALELERASLETKYTGESPEIRDKTAEIESIKREIARLDPMVEGKSNMILNQLHENIKGDLISARTELAGLEKTHSNVEEQIQIQEAGMHRLDQLALRFISLENKVDVDKKMLDLYLRKMDSARFVDSMNQDQITSLQVIQRARGAIPNRKPFLFNMIASVVLSLFLAFGMVFMMEMARPKVNSPEQAKNLLKLPVLATISKKAA